MRLALVVTFALTFSGIALTAAAPTAVACNPPSCPGCGGCSLVGGDVHVDPETLTIYGSAPWFECYY